MTTTTGVQGARRPDPSFLLDLLFARDGRTLTELESELEMTRFGVDEAPARPRGRGLVVTRRSGREKLHFLNPVPIRLIHDRWIDKYTEHHVTALVDLKKRWRTSHDHRPPPDRPRSTASGSRRRRSGSGPRSPTRSGTPVRLRGPSYYELEAAAVPRDRHQEMKDYAARTASSARHHRRRRGARGDPPRRLVQTWRMLMDPSHGGRAVHHAHYEIEDAKMQAGVCKLTITHELAGAPATAAMVAGTEDEGRGRRLGLDPQRPQDVWRPEELRRVSIHRLDPGGIRGRAGIVRR
jgi:hypothetical protein